ncbi:nucleoside triphosphate hydrolase [Oryzifoliimicrobium ureilyticus]|uniref:nucleoside triphosphate hydrolase n=1 Tax=Oryzifoliimicrobium ureilyticus TaxID=3113724 RepID=UPI00307616A8
MSFRVRDLADQLVERAGTSSRFLVGIAGPPGAGKSTLADLLKDALTEKGQTAAVLPMDGFHMDNAILIERGLLARKGIPETFDVRGFIDIIKAVKPADQEVLVPVFDRSREIAIASARPIDPKDKFIIVEGLYLLLKLGKWTELRDLFDFTVLLSPPEEVLEERLWDRWRGYRLSEDEARAKVEGNDLPNGRFILQNSSEPDLLLDVAMD